MSIIKKVCRILNKKQKRSAIYLFVLMTIQGILETVSVSLIIPIISIVMNPESVYENKYLNWIFKILKIENVTNFLILILALTILMYIVKNIFMLYIYKVQFKYVYNNQLFTSKNVFINYLYRPYEYYLNVSTADINRVLNGDVSSVFSIILIGLQFFTELIVAGCLIVLLFVVDATTTIGLGLILGGTLFINKYVLKNKLNKLGKKAIEYSAKSSKSLWQPINGIKEIKIAQREEYFITRYEECGKKANDATIKSNIFMQIPKLLVETVMIAGMLGIVILFLLTGKDIYSMISQLSAFALAAVRLMPCANRLNTYLNQISFFEPSLDIVLKEYGDTTSKKYVDQNDTSINFNQTIELKNISYHYPNFEEQILENANLKIKFGESIGVIGQSGAGKSTTIDILLGLLKPQKGQVLVDAIDIESAYRRWLSKVGYIPQVIFMLDDTIRRNIAFGIEDDKIDEEKLWNAIEEAQLMEFVTNLPEGLDTSVGERGVRISGGQRQRIGIARALYNNPNVLVFDEATSSLDNETEAAVIDSINYLKGKKTLIIIAHRLSTIQNCDRVYRVEDGKICETTI